jgi:hypothetical protein
VNELMHAGFEVAIPMRDKGVDLLVSPAGYEWTLPVQLKTSRQTVFQVHRKYVGQPLAVVYVLLGEKAQALPVDASGVYRGKGDDYSARTFWLTPTEAWRLPFDSGRQQDLDVHETYRFSWGPLLSGLLLSGKVASHRAELPGVVMSAQRRVQKAS